MKKKQNQTIYDFFPWCLHRLYGTFFQLVTTCFFKPVTEVKAKTQPQGTSCCHHSIITKFSVKEIRLKSFYTDDPPQKFSPGSSKNCCHYLAG